MKRTLDLYDTTGKVTSKVDVPKAFDVKIDPDLIALAIRVYQANQRQATSKVKTRGEVNRTTKKVWKQKGTGRARHGSRGAPIFVGGGVAHGPSGNQSYDLKLPKKMRQRAILFAVAQAVSDNRVILVDGLGSIKPNTKSVTTLIENLKLQNSKILCLLDQPITDFTQAAKNITNILVSQVKRTNVFEIITAEKIIFHQPAISVLVDTFSASVKKAISKPKVKKVVKAKIV